MTDTERQMIEDAARAIELKIGWIGPAFRPVRVE